MWNSEGRRESESDVFEESSSQAKLNADEEMTLLLLVPPTDVICMDAEDAEDVAAAAVVT